MENEMKRLKKAAIQIRRDILDMGTFGNGGKIHTGPALSSTEIVTALFFKIMNVNPKDPTWEDRDRFILSKGHAYPILYSALAEKGFFSREELLTARAINSRLQGHPALGKTPGVDMTSGSLGNGLSCGLGMALGFKLKGKERQKVYVLLGDGELQEGMIWEAAMAAPQLGADNLVAIVDYNHHQSCGKVENTIDLYPLEEKWKSFGWHVMEMNGHNMEDIVTKLSIAKDYEGHPVCIIAHTIKGKGVSFIEHNNAWHANNCTPEQYSRAMEELDAQERAIDAAFL